MSLGKYVVKYFTSDVREASRVSPCFMTYANILDPTRSLEASIS
jgi:hypothetical protein